MTITREQAAAIVTKEAKHVTDQDIEKVLDKSDEIRRQFESEGPLGKFIDDFKLLIALVKDYWHGRYKKTPTGPSPLSSRPCSMCSTPSTSSRISSLVSAKSTMRPWLPRACSW